MIDVNSTGRRPDRYALHRGRRLLLPGLDLREQAFALTLVLMRRRRRRRVATRTAAVSVIGR